MNYFKGQVIVSSVYDDYFFMQTGKQMQSFYLFTVIYFLSFEK